VSDADTGERSRPNLELWAAIILGAAALLTAFSAYKAALKDGDALQGYSQSTALLSDANFFYSQANQTFAQDQAMFLQYAVAVTEGNTDVAEYVRTSLMRPELQAAIFWFEEDPDAATPFDEAEGNPYVIDDLEEANRLQEESTARFEEGSTADEEGDKFELANVFLAASLFFAGIGTLFSRSPVQMAMLAIGVIGLGIGAVTLVTAL